MLLVIMLMSRNYDLVLLNLCDNKKNNCLNNYLLLKKVITKKS